MSIKDICQRVLNKYYPDVFCAILTGSQLNPDIVSENSDIDILLIDPLFSNTSSEGIK